MKAKQQGSRPRKTKPGAELSGMMKGSPVHFRRGADRNPHVATAYQLSGDTETAHQLTSNLRPRHRAAVLGSGRG